MPDRAFNSDKAAYENDPVRFIQTIGPIYCPVPAYAENVLTLYNSQNFRDYRMQLEDYTKRTIITYKIVSDSNDRLKNTAKTACNFWNSFIIPNSSIVIRLGVFTSYDTIIAQSYRLYISSGVVYGGIEFNTKYLNRFTDSEIAGTVIHEIGHTLGFGWDRWIGLFDRNSGMFKSEYIGIIPELQHMFAETDYGPGTQYAHWDEERFDRELMTGFKDSYE